MEALIKKRIEQAAREIVELSQFLSDFPHDKESVVYGALEMAKWLLSHQWISVEEALPPYDDRLKTISIDVIVMNEYGKATSAWYDYANKVWHLLYGEIAGDDVLDSKITHWMAIPQLKGGKK